MTNPIKIVIYEDEVPLRNGLSEFFEYDPSFLLVGSFHNCDNVLKNMQELQPDIVLMDKDMPGIDGLQGLIKIKTEFPQVEVVMHTGMTDDESVFQCLQAGASGYINKGTPRIQLMEYLKIVISGGTMFSPSIALKIRDFFSVGLPSNKSEFHLTPKEFEALGLLADGFSQKLIADRMDISINGVAAHLKNIFRKLQVNSGPEAVAKAIRLRLLDRDKLKFN